MKAIFKKLLFVCFGIVFAMLVSFGASAAAIPGDVNGDIEVNIRDAASVLLYANGKPVECVNDVVDANGDGVIDQNDAQTLLESITGHEDVVLNTGDACEHELSFVEGKERGTCPESGLSEHWVCSKCSKIFKDEDATILTNTAGVTIEPIHISGEWKEEVPATKTENGLKTIRCQNCQVLLDSEVIPYTGSVGLEYTLNTDGNSYSVSGIGTCTDTEIAIPSTYEGLPVTGIGDEAFSGCSQLVSVIMPDSIILVRSLAFDYCTNLMNVDFSDSITALGVQAFGNCASLTYIDLPKNLKHFNSHVFIGCTNLKSITIPENVEYIDEWAVFSYCPSIESIVVDENNQYYHSDNNCLIDTKNKALIYGCKNSIIPNDGSVTSLSDFAFAGCSELKSITIPASVTSIGTLAFGYCTGLETIVVEEGNPVFSSSGNCLILTATKEIILGCKKSIIPTDESVTKIGSSAFEYCTGLTSITIPGNIISIGSYAFSECSSLTNIVIPNSVTSIGAGAFEKCSSLTSITIPNSVKSIGNNAFFYCKNLSSFTFDGTAEEWEKVEKGKNWNDGCHFTEVKFTKVSASQGLEFTLNEDGQSYSVSGLGTCTDTDIVIPATYEGLLVTRIGDNAFYECSIIGITIPDSVTSIGDYAFLYCSSLTIVTIPNSVTSIGSGAFNNCSELTNIIIPDSVISIGNSAFAGCTSLTSINIPNSITSIGAGIFKRCSSLTRIILPNSITSIGNGAFENCTSLTSVNIPNSVINLGDRAFSTCSSLISIIVPNSVTSIGKYVFRDCKNLSTFIFDGTAEEWEKVAKGENWNSGCPFTEVIFTKTSESQGLEFTLNEDGQSYTVSGIGTCTDTEIVIPATYEGLPVTRIGDDAFYNCSIIGITIPDSVTSIGDEAFSYCPELKSLYITNKVTYIGSHAFVACSEMESIVVEPGNTFYHSDNNCLIETASKKLIVGCQNSVIPTDGSVTSIGDLAFSWSNLSSINIPDCITSIGKEAFSFNYFDSINIPDSITSIGDYAFVGCYFLTNVDMPNGITNIGEMMFYGCANLTSITIPNSVTSIGYEAFYECTSLSTFIFDGTAEEWEKVEKGENWNYGCPFTEVKFTSSSAPEEPEINDSVGLEYTLNSDGQSYSVSGIGTCTDTEIVIPSTYEGLPITQIGNSAFKNCSILTSIAIPNSVTSIGEYAFYCCYRLTSITIPNSVTSIGGSVFYGCSSLTSINIPNSVTSIGEYAFIACSNLTSITIPNSVTSIGDFAFKQCSNLTSITISNSVTSIGEGVFDFCPKLESIVVEEGNTVYHSYNNCLIETASKTLVLGCKNSIIPTDGNVTSIGMYAFYGCSSLTSINIPDGVTSIEEGAFFDCSSLTSIGIPNSVTSIGAFAFDSCSSLTSISIPNSVTSIGAYAFSYCTNLSSFTFDGTAEEWIKVKKGTNWHYDCPFTEVIFTKETHIHDLVHVEANPPSCTENGNIEYWYCSECDWMELEGGIATNKEAVTLPASHNLKIVMTQNASCTCPGLVVQECSVCKLIIYDTLDMLPHTESDWITDIEPTDTKDGHRYKSCTVCGQTVASEIILRPGATEHEHSIVTDPAIDATCAPGKTEGKHCEICGAVIVPQEDIPPVKGHEYMLVSSIPPSCTTSGYQYFHCLFCGVDKSKEMPPVPHDFSNWTIVHPTATKDGYKSRTCMYCGLIEKIILEATGSVGLEYSLNEDRQSYSVVGIGTCTDTEIVIPSTYQDKPVTGIGANAFNRCENITEVIIPNGVTNIGAQAFAFCFSLTNVTIPDSITSIGGQAFGYCSELKTIKIPAGLTSIGSRAFALCTGLTSINIPEGVKVIESSAFESCISMTSVTIPNSITEIHEYAFKDCSALKSIVIPNSVKKINSGILINCSSLESIVVEAGNAFYHSDGNCLIDTKTMTLLAGCKNSVIPDDGSVATIGYSAFKNCIELTSITIPNSVTSMDIYAFSGCIGLTEIIIPESFTSIAGAAFSGCENLTSVVIPTSVNHIDNMAFEGCGNLKNFIMPDSIESIGDSVFEWCYNLQSITISGNITSIGNSVFYNCNALYDVYFNGTVSEWSAVAKGNSWKDGAHFTIVHCTDGDVSVN